MKVELLAYTPNPEELIAKAAKLCYSQTMTSELVNKMNKEDVEKFVNHLASIGYESPLEHVNFTFAIEGISRACSHQLVRHRQASFSQQSQRYVKENELDFVIPEAFEKSRKGRLIYRAFMMGAHNTYKQLVDILQEEAKEEFISLNENYTEEELNKHLKVTEKYAIENARYVLPNGAETKMVVTMNARELLHVFKVRRCNRVQKEIRDLADEMNRLVAEVAPSLFIKSGPDCITEGVCHEGKMFCGNPRGKLKSSMDKIVIKLSENTEKSEKVTPKEQPTKTPVSPETCSHRYKTGESAIAYDSPAEMRSKDMHCKICGKNGSWEELSADTLKHLDCKKPE